MFLFRSVALIKVINAITYLFICLSEIKRMFWQCDDRALMHWLQQKIPQINVSIKKTNKNSIT